MTSQTSTELEIRRFAASYESLGILLDYLGSTAPFETYRVRSFLPAVKHQLAKGYHVAAFRGEELVGYCGWLYTTTEIGERWLAHAGELKPMPEEEADAAALTIVRVDERPALAPMIRSIRRIGAGKRIFFRRDYGGANPRQKRQTVLNTTGLA